MQIRSEVSTKLPTDKQTNKQRRKHNLLGGGNNVDSQQLTAVMVYSQTALYY